MHGFRNYQQHMCNLWKGFWYGHVLVWNVLTWCRKELSEITFGSTIIWWNFSKIFFQGHLCRRREKSNLFELAMLHWRTAWVGNEWKTRFDEQWNLGRISSQKNLISPFSGSHEVHSVFELEQKIMAILIVVLSLLSKLYLKAANRIQLHHSDQDKASSSWRPS